MILYSLIAQLTVYPRCIPTNCSRMAPLRITSAGLEYGGEECQVRECLDTHVR